MKDCLFKDLSLEMVLNWLYLNVTASAMPLLILNHPSSSESFAPCPRESQEPQSHPEIRLRTNTFSPVPRCSISFLGALQPCCRLQATQRLLSSLRFPIPRKGRVPLRFYALPGPLSAFLQKIVGAESTTRIIRAAIVSDRWSPD